MSEVVGLLYRSVVWWYAMVLLSYIHYRINHIVEIPFVRRFEKYYLNGRVCMSLLPDYGYVIWILQHYEKGKQADAVMMQLGLRFFVLYLSDISDVRK